jgi:hypothetical protein
MGKTAEKGLSIVKLGEGKTRICHFRNEQIKKRNITKFSRAAQKK